MTKNEREIIFVITYLLLSYTVLKGNTKTELVLYIITATDSQKPGLIVEGMYSEKSSL